MNLIYKFFIIAICVFAMGPNHLLAREANLDSLENVIATSKIPSDKITSYLILSKYYAKKSIDKALYYLDESEKLCKENNLDSLYTMTLFRQGKYLFRKNRAKSLKKYRHALKLFDKIDDAFLKSKIYNNMGRIFLLENVPDSGIYYFNKSIEIKKLLTEKYPDDYSYARSYGLGLLNLGTLYVNKSDYKKAISILYASLDQMEKIEDSAIMCSIHLNIGVIHYYYKDYDNALKEFLHANAIANSIKKMSSVASSLSNIGVIYEEKKEWNKADSLFREALKIRLEIGPSSSIAGIYENLGLIAKEKENYEEALGFYNNSLEIKEKSANTSELAALYANLGNLFYLKKEYSKAEEYLLKAKKYIKSADDPEKNIEINLSLSKLYEAKSNYNTALKYYKNYKLIDDSVHSLKSEETINLFKEKFNTAEKDRKISEFEQKQKLDELVKEKQSLNNKMLMIGIFAIILIFVFIIIIFNNRRKAEKELFVKNSELNKQKMLELITEQEMESVNSFISGQERERARIASDLHDRLGSLLSTVKLHFSSLEPFLEKDKELSENFSYAITLLDKSVDEVRSVSHNLAKEILTEFGIVVAIENMKEAINSAGNLQMVFINSGFDHRLPYEYEMEIYRIIQEIVTNAIKHAKASEIVIQFVVDGDNLTITIEDDGIGFDVANIKSDGMGLSNIFERTAKINGKYAIDTAPGNGTTFIFDIPIGQNS